MVPDMAGLRKDERVAFTLRRLYERYGYKKYRMRRFEEYELYLENKSFLGGGRMITFSGADGRLLALKPDVTLSIVKNADVSPEKSEKLYYVENVYRAPRQGGQFAEINQMGLEYLGRVDGYAAAEVLRLAAQSLEAVDEDYILDISHMGFLSGILSELGLEGSAQERVLECVRSKNTHDLRREAAAAGVSEEGRERLQKLAGLYGRFEECRSKAEEAAGDNPQMLEALGELRELCRLAEAGGFGDKIRLDFSITGDVDYYNGVIFRGFVNKAPRAVLSGGRYDKLLEKFGKKAGAIGFALYLDGLTAYYEEPAALDCDVLLLYGERDDPAEVLKETARLTAEGKSVRAELSAPEGLRFGEALRLGKEALRDV